VRQLGHIKRQRGISLVVSLVLLVGVTVVSLSTLSTSLLEMLMAGAEEARMTAFQKAQAGIEAIASEPANFAVVGGVGDSNCTTSFSGSESCSRSSLTLPAGFDSAKHAARSERLNPLLACPPRAFATSCDAFKVAHFSIDSRFKDTANRGGRSEILQGFMVLVPLGGEEVVLTDADYVSP
jgi:hypothetical protein